MISKKKTNCIKCIHACAKYLSYFPRILTRLNVPATRTKKNITYVTDKIKILAPKQTLATINCSPIKKQFKIHSNFETNHLILTCKWVVTVLLRFLLGGHERPWYSGCFPWLLTRAWRHRSVTTLSAQRYNSPSWDYWLYC